MTPIDVRFQAAHSRLSSPGLRANKSFPGRLLLVGRTICLVLGTVVSFTGVNTCATFAHLQHPVDKAGQNLLGWLEQYGASVCHDIAVIKMPPLGRELVATSEIDAHTELIQLPPELCLAISSTEQLQTLDEDVRMALDLLRAVNGPGWEAYQAVWPSEAELAEQLPIFWGSERLQQAACSFPGLPQQVFDRRQLLQEVASQLEVQPQKLIWAHALVSTRAVGAGIGTCAMVPGVDLANHSPNPNTELVVAGEPGTRCGRATVTKYGQVWEHGSAGLVAKRRLMRNEVIRISYGNYPNQRLLLDYGFSLGCENPNGDLEKSTGDNAATTEQQEGFG